jgi:hypothetical protein
MGNHAEIPLPLSPKSILYLLTSCSSYNSICISSKNTFDSICMGHDGINKKSAPAKIKCEFFVVPYKRVVIPFIIYQ